MDFKKLYRAKFSLGRQIASRQRLSLCAATPGLTDQKLLAMDTCEVEDLLCKRIAPRSSPEFFRLLTNSVQFIYTAKTDPR